MPERSAACADARRAGSASGKFNRTGAEGSEGCAADATARNMPGMPSGLSAPAVVGTKPVGEVAEVPLGDP